MKKLFRKLHLWLSLPFGVIFSIICLTGAMLVFEKEITQMVAPELVKAEQVVKAHAYHQAPMVMHGNAMRPEQGDKMQGKKERLPFFQTVFKLHRWLLDAPAKKGESSVGKMVVGVSTIMMVFVLLSGLVVWVPRSRKMARNRLRVSVGKGWRRFVYDSHVSLGFYVTIFLLIMALTGLTWSFSWYREAFVSIFDGIVEPDGMKRFIFTLHTGSWGGTITKTIYFLSALIGAALPWSGYYMWYKKLR